MPLFLRLHLCLTKGNLKTLQIGQTCDRAGTTEHLNGRWWPPAARPRPLVSDWWAKLDLLSELQGVRDWGDWKHPLKVMAVSGAGDMRNMACQSHTLCYQKEPAVACQTCHPCARQTSQAKLSQQDSTGQQLYQIERGYVYIEVIAVSGCKTFFFFFKNKKRSLPIAILRTHVLYSSWAGCRNWDCSTVDSASWIVSKIQQDICSIDRNAIAWRLTKRENMHTVCVCACKHVDFSSCDWAIEKD